MLFLFPCLQIYRYIYIYKLVKIGQMIEAKQVEVSYNFIRRRYISQVVFVIASGKLLSHQEPATLFACDSLPS